MARVFRRIAPAILWLTLATGEVVGTTPGHEVWTFERGWGPAAELTAGESFLTPAGAAATILDVVIDPTPTPVYNFEVRGTHTYFAAGAWVHNMSCDIWSQQKWNKLTGEAYQDWVNALYGFTRNTRKLPSGHVPDIWDASRGIIGDVKSGVEIGQTRQLEAIYAYAKQNGLTPVIIASESNSPRIYDWVTDRFKIIWAP